MSSRTLGFALILFATFVVPVRAGQTLLNASYDVTREFYSDYNALFAKYWLAKTGENITIKQSHGGSRKQARAVIEGLEADVVTMNQPTDIDMLHDTAGLVQKDWRNRFPNGSAPYSSPIVFLVRKGNPKGIHDWGDLVKGDVKPIIPNPKTSGNGRYSYLAAWGYGLGKTRNEADARAFVAELFKRVPVLDTGGRAATTTFVEREIGDVLLTFENEVYLIAKKINPKDFDVVIPSVSITAEAPVAVIDAVVDKRGTRKVAEAYLGQLWSDAAQRLIAQHYFRPNVEAVRKETQATFPAIRLLSLEDVARDWAAAEKKHFADGGVFDQIYLK
jgi:sulfate transport system substrate-binding protein